MNYFTRERYLALQNFDDAAMDAADANWEDAVNRYDDYLDTVRPELAESVRQLLDGFYLHDARVLSMGQRQDTFVITLQLDVPPNELLTITYTLAGQPILSKETFAWAGQLATVAWLYEEIELVREGDQPHLVHSILLSNGWEIRVPFRTVEMATAVPLLPLPRCPSSVATSASTSQTA